TAPSPRWLKAQSFAHPLRHNFRSIPRRRRANERNGIFSFIHQVASQPSLPALHRLNRVKEVRARSARRTRSLRPEVGDWQSLFRRFPEKEVAKRGPGGPCELRQLPDRGGDLLGFP